MVTTIKAIETQYNGYRFRSRLEARWAVFFDVLGVKYEYEKEGYDLGDAGWYLPDFWLPDLDCWVEIKGGAPSHEEQYKAFKLANISLSPVIMCTGNIGSGEQDYRMTIYLGYHHPDKFEILHMSGWHFDYFLESLPEFLRRNGFENVPDYDGGTRKCIERLIALDQKYYKDKYGVDHPKYIHGLTRKCVWGAEAYSRGKIYGLHLIDREVWDGCIPDPIEYAHTAARSARFEHGEHGL